MLKMVYYRLSRNRLIEIPHYYILDVFILSCHLPTQGTCTWQFNFKFNLSEDMYAEESVDLLKNSGIHFERHEREGIETTHFAEMLIVSGMLLLQLFRGLFIIPLFMKGIIMFVTWQKHILKLSFSFLIFFFFSSCNLVGMPFIIFTKCLQLRLLQLISTQLFYVILVVEKISFFDTNISPSQINTSLGRDSPSTSRCHLQNQKGIIRMKLIHHYRILG